MLPDRVSNPGPPTYESGVLLIALCGLAGDTIERDEKTNRKMLKLLPLKVNPLTVALLHSERPKLHTILAFLSAIGLKVGFN